MALTYSPSLRITLIGNGDQPGAWGGTTNTNLGTLIEDGIAGYEVVSVTSASQALTTVDGSADQARNAVLQFTTTTTANFAVYAPNVSKMYIIYNSTAYTATVYNQNPATPLVALGTGAIIPAGQTLICVSNGTNFRLTDAGTGYVTLTGSEVLTNKTLTDVNLNGSYTEDVYAITGTFGDFSPLNGTIQTWTLTGNSTAAPNSSGTFTSGQSMTLMIAKGAYTLTISFVTWVGGVAPTLPATGYGVIELWKVGAVTYGAYVGAVA